MTKTFLRRAGLAVAATAMMLGSMAANAFSLTFQGVTFTATVVDSNTFTLRIENALSTTDTDWAPATSLQSLGFKNLGIDFSAAGVSATLTSNPAGTTAWTGIHAELNAQGCSTNGAPDGAICFTGVPPLALTDDMLFTIDITGATLNIDALLGPHVKVQFLNSRGGKQGSLLSQNLPGDTDTDTDTDVPEPGTLALLGLGLIGIGAARRRKA